MRESESGVISISFITYYYGGGGEGELGKCKVSIVGQVKRAPHGRSIEILRDIYMYAGMTCMSVCLSYVKLTA